jgi:hypothetical protein
MRNLFLSLFTCPRQTVDSCDEVTKQPVRLSRQCVFEFVKFLCFVCSVCKESAHSTLNNSVQNRFRLLVVAVRARTHVLCTIERASEHQTKSTHKSTLYYC